GLGRHSSSRLNLAAHSAMAAQEGGLRVCAAWAGKPSEATAAMTRLAAPGTTRAMTATEAAPEWATVSGDSEETGRGAGVMGVSRNMCLDGTRPHREAAPPGRFRTIFTARCARESESSSGPPSLPRHAATLRRTRVRFHEILFAVWQPG